MELFGLSERYDGEVADTQPTLAACARGSRSETAQADNMPLQRPLPEKENI